MRSVNKEIDVINKKGEEDKKVGSHSPEDGHCISIETSTKRMDTESGERRVRGIQKDIYE